MAKVIPGLDQCLRSTWLQGARVRSSESKARQLDRARPRGVRSKGAVLVTADRSEVRVGSVRRLLLAMPEDGPNMSFTPMNGLYALRSWAFGRMYDLNVGLISTT